MNGGPHIRRRYPRNTGNSRYKDRRTFDGPEWERHTFCRAEITDRDLGWAQRNNRWTRENACPDCLAAVKAEEPKP
jgi:hypothetical protein